MPIPPDIGFPCVPDARHLPAIARRAQAIGNRYWPAEGSDSAIFAARYPDRARLVAMAELAVRRKIQFWQPWHMEVTHRPERLVRGKEWFTAGNGDPEWLDSLVRFTHMVDLAAAWRITSRPQYGAAFREALAGFARARATPHRHWGDQLNAALRVVNLIKAIDLLPPVQTSDDVLHAAYLEVLTDCEFLRRNLGQRGGNWEVAITTALLTACEYLRDVLDVADCRGDALARLQEVLASEIHGDGVQIEEVPLYHGEVAIMVLDYITILRSNQRPVDSTVAAAATALITTLRALADPEGQIPPIGDSDRLSIAYIEHLADALAIPHTAPHDDATAGCDASLTVETFPETGWAIARWGTGTNRDRYLLFDASGKPYPGKSWHSHADDLSFLFHTADGPLITDPGRFTYARGFPVYVPGTNHRLPSHGPGRLLSWLVRPGARHLNSRDWRAYFRATASHNTVCCDGQDQPGYGHHRTAGPAVTLQRAVYEGPLLWLEGSLDTRRVGKDHEHNGAPLETDLAYTQRRIICGCLPGMLIIVDQVVAECERTWIHALHFAPAVRVALHTHGAVATLGRRRFSIGCLNADDGRRLRLDPDWVSTAYNEKRRALTLRTTVPATHHTDFVTTIAEDETAFNPSSPAAVAPVRAAESGALDGLVVRRAEGSGSLAIAINLRGGVRTLGPIETDADIAVARWGRDGSLTTARLGGTTMRVAD